MSESLHVAKETPDKPPISQVPESFWFGVRQFSYQLILLFSLCGGLVTLPFACPRKADNVKERDKAPENKKQDAVKH